MDNKKLARLIDKIVVLRVKKVLKSPEFQQLIQERVSKEVIKLLVEVNLSPNKTITQPTHKRTSNSTNLTDLLKEKNQVNYPRLPEKRVVNKTFSKNPALNKLLNQTAQDKVGLARLNSSGNPLMDMSGMAGSGIDMGALTSEGPGMIQSELSKLGIDPSRISNIDELAGDIDVPVEGLTQEDMLSEGLDNIDISETVQTVGDDDRYGHLVNALTKDYSEVLNLVDEKVKSRRPMMISAIKQPSTPITV